MEDTLLIIVSFVISAFLTGKLRWKAQDANKTESVVGNSARKKKLPTGVGFAFAIITTILGASYLYFIRPEIATEFLYTALAAGFIVSHAAYKQDMDEKNGALISTLALVIAIGASVYALPQIYGSHAWLPLWAEKIIIAIMWFGFVKTSEKHDTVDGLFPTVSIIILLAIGFMNIYVMPLVLILVSTLIAFLKLTIYPAKAVMGNSGRRYIAFMVMALALATASDLGRIYLLAIILILSSIWIFSCHKIAMKAIAAGHTYKAVVTHYIVMTLACCIFTLYALHINFITPFVLASIVIFTIYRAYIKFITGKQ